MATRTVNFAGNGSVIIGNLPEGGKQRAHALILPLHPALSADTATTGADDALCLTTWHFSSSPRGRFDLVLPVYAPPGGGVK
jgi:hypothetical protein